MYQPAIDKSAHVDVFLTITDRRIGQTRQEVRFVSNFADASAVQDQLPLLRWPVEVSGPRSRG
jgi:hypothetical protein